MTKQMSTNKTLKVATSAALIASSFSTIVAPISASTSFPDIAGNYHEKDILQLLDRKIIQGYPDGTFKPENSITRGQAAKMIASVLNLDTKNITNPGFLDVDEKHEFYPYIAALAKLNVINGYEDGTFKQDATITRGQMAKMIALGFNLTSNEKHPFNDVAEGSIYAPYIQALFNYNVTTGTTDTTFSPRNNVTRGQLASFVIRAENAAKAPINDTVEGTIEEVLTNAIIIDGKTIAVSADFSKVLSANKQALEGAKIALNTKDGEATNIIKLELAKDATSFDGNGLPINTLSIPASIKKLANVTAETIHYHVTDQQLIANNIKASDFYLNNEKIVLASIANVSLPSNVANITFNGSTIENVHSNIDEVTISKTGTTIKNIFAKNTQQLTLNGDFTNVTISSNTNITGTSKIETLIFEEQPSKYSVGTGISVSTVKYAGQTYTWNDFIAKFPTQQEGPSETPTEDGSTSGNSSSNGGSNTGSNTNNENTGDKENPPVIENPVIIIDEKNNTVTVNDESFDVTEAQKQFLAEQKESIKDIQLATNETNETIIESISIATNDFDGTDLSNVGIKNLIVTAQNISNIIDVETITINNSKATSLSNIVADKIVANGAIKEIKNTTANEITVQSTEQNLIVNATATTLDLQNTSADVIVRGNIESIVGGENNTLTIATSTPTVNVNNVNANEIIIEEALPAVFASLSFMRTFATPINSAMTVKFAGDYSNKTLTVKRSDSIVDVQSTTPFSRVAVAGNGTLLNSSTPLANVTVAANVTKFTLNADVEEFALDLASPIEITSEAGITIQKLAVTKKAANTDGYISLLNVNIENTTVNDNSDPTLLFKQAVTNDTFTSSLSAQTYPNFGKVKLVLPNEITGPVKVLQVPKGQDTAQYINVANAPSSAQDYSGDFFLEADTENVIVYATVNGSLAISIINTSNIPKFLVIPSYNSGNLMVFTRYDVNKSLDETMDYLYIFDEGKLVYENNDFAGVTQTTDGNGQRTFTLNTGVKTLNGSFESIVSEGGIYHYSSPENASTYFAPVLKELAKKAHAAGKPEMIKNLLAEMSSFNTTTFDSLFLKEYVKELATNPNAYNTTQDILDLIEELTPKYQVDIQLTAADLYLNSIPAASSATYSKQGIVEVAVSESEGKLMLNPLAEGTTTVRVEDKDGLATLINVTVTKDQSGKLVIKNDATGFNVIALVATQGNFLDGVNNFRFFTKGTDTFLLPTKLEESFALVQLATPASNPIGNVVHGYALTQSTTGYTLSAKRDITPVEISLQDLGLQAIKGLTIDNIGVLSNAAGNGIILFPRAVGSELAYFGDDNNITAVNIVTSETTITTADIAKSPNVLSIADDLKLDAITNTTMYPQGSLDIHYTNDGNDIQFFTNKATKVSYVFADSGNRKTIVNVESTNTGGKLKVADGQIVKHDLSMDENNVAINAGATVTNISGTSVRAHNLEIFATQTGTSIVTLSNGNQYQFDVKQTGNQFTIDVEEVTNEIIEAATLHMTNIKEATSSNASDRLQVVDGKLVVNLAADGTSKITVLSNTVPVETTVLYVTKNGNDYTFDPATDIVRTELEANALGLGSVTNVFGEPTSTARIKLGADGKVYVYGFAEGTRSFRVNDGTKNTAINVTVSKSNADKLTVNAEAVKFSSEITANSTISSTAARIEGTTLYATGLGLDANGQATIEVPVAYTGADNTVEAFESIVLTQHPDTKLLSFGDATKTFKKSINKVDFDFSTLHNPTVSSISGNGISTAINGDKLTITAIADSEARVQINESTAADKKAFVYVKRDGNDFTATVEKSTATALKDYGYTTTPATLTAPFTKEGIVRAHIDENFNVDFYALAAGKTAYKVEDGKGKNLFINVEVNNKENATATESNQRYVHTSIVESETLPVHDTDPSIKATIIEGDAVRLSADKTKLYANKLGSKSIVKDATGNFSEYEVILNADGQYELDITPIAKSAMISKATLGLDGTLQVSGLDGAIASYSITNDGIIIYGNNNGTTSMTVSNGSKSLVVNVTVADSGVAISDPVETTTSAAPILIDPSDANIVRIDGTTVYALAAGTAEVIVDNEVQQITVTKGTNNHYEISNPVKISDAVYSATDLGFDANAAMTIESSYNTTDFVVTNVGGKIVAYSKLAAGATGTTEVIINASGERTLVNLKDTGIDLIEATIAKQENLIAADTVIADKTVARQKAGTVYALKEGSTHATKASGYIQAVDVKRTNGLLTATVTDVKLNGKYSTLTETDTSLIGIVDGDVYVKKTSGKTTVQKTITEGTGADAVDVTKVYEITISNTNGKIEISEKLLSSKTLLAADAQLTNITSAEVLYGTNPNAVTLSVLDKENTKNGLAIYSNATAAQSLAILVTDSAGHKAIIDVTLDETGTITNAAYVKKTTTVAFSENKVVQETNARGVWNGTTLTTYAIGEGNAALKFANGLINVTTTKAATNKVTMSSNVLEHTGFTNTLNNITNGDILKSTATGFYPTATGSALIHADNKVYSINVTLENGLYTLDVSDGVSFTTLAIGENDAYNNIGSTLNGVSVAVDEDANDDGTKDDKQLIIYKESAAAGTSDLLITSGGLKTIYQVKTDGITIEDPEEAKGTIDAAMTGSTIIGDSIRLNGTDIYYLAEKVSTIKSDTNGRLVTIDVKRDGNGYFTATPEYVTGTVTVAPTTLNNYDIVDKTIYAKSTDTDNATESALITDPTDTSGEKAYYTTFSTTRTGDKFAVKIDERKAYQYNPADDFGLTSAYEVVSFEGDNIATVKTIDSKLAIIAGDATGDATITIKDDAGKQLILKVNRQADGTFIVTPQASLNNILFSTMELDGTTNAITAEGFDSNIINVTATAQGLNIIAIKEGTTSLRLKQDDKIVGLVNVTIAKTLNGSLQITSTPLSYEATDKVLYADSEARKGANKYYPTAIGKTLYKTDTGAQFVIFTQNATTKLYEVSNTTHTLAEFTAADLGLTTINAAAAATAAVGTLPSTDRSKLYVYGQNDGTTDIVVSDGTNNTVIVAMNGATLTTAVARKEIDSALAAVEWTSTAPTVAAVRGGFIYSQEPGAALLQATIGGRTVLMNATVIRNGNNTFNIQPEVVSANKDTWSTVEILSGSDIVAVDGTTIYAQKAGTATVKIKDTTNVTKVYTVTVSENTNGTMKIEVGQPMTHHEFTAAELGLDSITKAVVQSINGAGVVTAQIQNGVLVVLAKASGQAQLSVNEGQTFIHMLVDDVNGELTLIPTIAETTIAGATSITKSEGDDAIVRFKGEKIYALKEGKIVALVDQELYNVSVETKNNKLTPTANRIEYEFTGAQSVEVADTSTNVLKVDDKTIIATGYGSKTVSVDDKTYKVTVNKDGSIDVVLFAAGQFDFAQSALAQQFTDLTNATITSHSSLVTPTVTGTTITLTPKDAVTANATDIITVENGSTTVQLKATIERVTNGFAVTSVELVSKTLNASDLNNIYAATILNTNGTTFNSSIGLMRTENGILTVYPGAAGEEHFIVRDGEGNQSLFALTSTPTNSAQSFEVKLVSLTLAYDNFQYVPTVLATKGTAKATNVGQDLNIQFADTTETVFVTTSGQNLYHTVLTKPKVSTSDSKKFDVSEHVIQPITPIVGDITNVTPGLHAISHNGKTLLYANAETPSTSYFTDPNGIINKVTVGANYALTNEKVYAANDVTYTSLQLMQGEDVVLLESNKLAAKKTGSGIYKTDTNDYVEINVAGNETTGYTVTPKILDKKDLSSLGTNVKVLAPTAGIYADGTVVYGLTTEKIAISIDDAIYTTTMTDGIFDTFKRLELDLTTALGWSAFASHTLVNDSQFGTITGTTFIPKSVNTNGETITFTTAMGIKKQLKIIVKDDFTIAYEAGLDEIGYQFSTSNASIQFTFDVNVDAIPDDLQFIVDAGGTVYPSKAPLFIWTGTNTNYEGTFTLNIPEYDQTATPPGKSFTISAMKDEEWQIPAITSDKLKFLHIVR